MKIIYIIAVYIIGFIVFITVMETFGIGDSMNIYLERKEHDELCKII
jgi:hypothetical protein